MDDPLWIPPREKFRVGGKNQDSHSWLKSQEMEGSHPEKNTLLVGRRQSGF